MGQGKRKDQIESSERIADICIIVCGVSLLIAILLNLWK